MNKAHEDINWVNYPLTDTALNASNLNKMDRSIDVIDDRVVEMDTTKANATDMLQAFVDVDIDDNTGVITFTKKNGTTITLNTNLNKLAVNMRYDGDPTSANYQKLILTYNTDPVTYGYIDLTALITQYEFTDSTAIHFSITNGKVSASIIDGSITAEKLQPNFLADCQSAKNDAQDAQIGSGQNALVSEGWAKGTQNGMAVPSTSPYYHNNAEWFKDQAQEIAAGSLAGLSDVELDSVTQGQIIYYDETLEKWINGNQSTGILPHLHILTESDATVTIAGLTPTQTSAGVWDVDIPSYGTYLVQSVNSSGTQNVSVVVDTCKIYDVSAYHFNATITVTFPGSATCTCSKSGVTYTATSTPYTFNVNSAGNWMISITEDGQTVAQNIEITTTGQTESLTLDFAYIALTIPSELIGQTVTITDGTSTRTWVSSATTHTFVCILGNYTLSIGGYSTSVNVVAYTTYTASIETWGYKGWLASASIADTFGSLENVIADEATVRTLMTKHTSCDYLYNWYSNNSSILSTILSNTNTVKWFGLRDYVCDKFMANASAKTAILASTNWAYILKDKVPVMTGASAPYGTASANSEYSSTYSAYKAFDNDINTTWSATSGTTDGWLRYNFANPICVRKVIFDTNYESQNLRLKTFSIQASNDGTNWTTLKELTTLDNANVTHYEYDITNDDYYLYYQMANLSSYQTAPNIKSLQFYGRALNVSVPKMTSNTAPFGVVSASSTLGTNYDAWKAFNGTNASATDGWVSAQNDTVGAWIKYDFGKPVRLVKVYLQNRNESTPWAPHNFKIQGSNTDGNDYADIISGTITNNTQNAEYTFDSSDSTSYRYMRLYVVDTESRAYVGLGKLQFYCLDESEHTERHWIYDHGIELETIHEPYTIPNGGTSTMVKGSDSITVNDSSTTYAYPIITDSSIDLTDFTLMRCVFPNIVVSQGRIGIGDGSGLTAWYAYANNSTLSLPNNCALDITSVTSGYPSIMSDTTSISGGSLELTEWWLE